MDWVTVAAAAAAWVAAWQAIKSARTAKRAYSLALEQERRLLPSLEIYLVDTYIRRLETLNLRLYVFQLMITNKSYAGNSLRDIQLLIQHGQGSTPTSQVAIPHKSDLVTHLPGANQDALQIPSPIAAHAIVGGLALFDVPDDLLRESRIESYNIKVVDSYGHETQLEAILLQERGDERVEEAGDPAK